MPTTNPNITMPLTTKPLTTNPSITNTNTTKPFTTTPSLTKCNDGTPPSYTSLRKDNIDKIKLYYNKLLDEYTKAYTEYSTNKNSTIVSDREDAEAILKPRAEAYNTQIINLSKELIESVDKDTDLILQQKTELEEKQKLRKPQDFKSDESETLEVLGINRLDSGLNGKEDC